MYLIKSWIGEVEERATFNVYTGTHWQDCFNGELISVEYIGGGSSFRWKIEYGQYSLFWGAQEWSSANPYWRPPPYSVTYTVSIN